MKPSSLAHLPNPPAASCFLGAGVAPVPSCLWSKNGVWHFLRGQMRGTWPRGAAVFCTTGDQSQQLPPMGVYVGISILCVQRSFTLTVNRFFSGIWLKMPTKTVLLASDVQIKKAAEGVCGLR